MGIIKASIVCKSRSGSSTAKCILECKTSGIIVGNRKTRSDRNRPLENNLLITPDGLRIIKGICSGTCISHSSVISKSILYTDIGRTGSRPSTIICNSGIEIFISGTRIYDCCTCINSCSTRNKQICSSNGRATTSKYQRTGNIYVISYAMINHPTIHLYI